MFSKAPHEGNKVRPSHAPFLPPKLEVRGRCRTQLTKERQGRGRNSVKTSLFETGRQGLHYLRYITAGVWDNLGGLRTVLLNPAHLRELSVIQNMGTDSRFEGARSTAWAHVARDRGGSLVD